MTNILVVENAKLLCNIISIGLEELNYKCTKAFSLADIKDELNKQEFNYIVLNLYLPDADEMELITTIQKISKAKLIVLTSKTDGSLRDMLFKYGIVDYLLKENITQTIENIHKLITSVELNANSKVLIIDDSKVIRRQISNILTPRAYEVLESATGQLGLDIINEESINLLILDMELDENMHGLEVLEQIKLNPNNKFPILVLSGATDPAIISKVLKGGANDFMHKPIIIEEFLLKADLWVDYFRKSMELENYKKTLEGENFSLELSVGNKMNEIYALNKEITATQKEVVMTMGSIGEMRSKETGNHVKRVAQYSYLLALKYGLSQEDAELLRLASPMHDIGKVAIPDAVLNKPGRFNDEERAIMNNHPKLGYDMLCNSKRDIMKAAATVAYEHHEKWDGTGYPRGLKGEDIHIFGRITALADVFDALGSDRVYKKAWDDEKIWKMFKEEKDIQFEGKLVDIFFEHLDEFLAIRDELTD